MQVGDLFHAEPAELGAAHRARHVVAAAVVHLDDQHVAAGTDLHLGARARVRPSCRGSSAACAISSPAAPAAAASATSAEGGGGGREGGRHRVMPVVPTGAGGIAGLVRVPLSFAVVAERVATT